MDCSLKSTKILFIILFIIVLVQSLNTSAVLVNPESIQRHTDLVIPKERERHVFGTKSLANAMDYCQLAVNPVDAIYFRNIVEDLNFNFAQFKIKFHGNYTINQTSDAVLPRHWVWTYFLQHGIVPYLKWPVDFRMLSFTLLDMKTLSPALQNLTIGIDVRGTNCHLELGSKRTTKLLGEAFRNLTSNYLAIKQPKQFNYSYWCYLKEVPGIKEKLSYKLGVHFGFPVEFTKYNCCRTSSNLNRTKLNVRCIDQIPRMRQTIYAPFILAVLTFAYFPIFLFSSIGSSLSRHYDTRGYQRLCDVCEDGGINGDGGDHSVNRHPHMEGSECGEEENQNWVYLDGKPPITFTYLLSGRLCGIVDKYPICASRCRRFLFLVILPIILYIEIGYYLYYMQQILLAYLDHGAPLGYLSLIRGWQKSMSNFAPYLGGPPCLLGVYHIAAIIFFCIPTDLASVMHEGSALKSDYRHLFVPLIGDDLSTKLSGMRLNDYYGYSRVSVVCKARIYMLVNLKFWRLLVSAQVDRMCKIYKWICVKEVVFIRYALYLTFCICIFPYMLLCLIELALCLTIYGIPAILVILVFAKGYTSWTIAKFRRNRTIVTHVTEVLGRTLLQSLVYLFFVCLFLYFAFGVSSILCQSFRIIFEHIIFCFIAMFAYPGRAFGYIFFVTIMVYYVFKQLEHFGNEYFELLSMAIEIGIHSEENSCSARLENGVIVLSKTQGTTISKLKIHDHIINLSTNQRMQIQNIKCKLQQRIRYRRNIAGIPRELFEHLVDVFKPIRKQVLHTLIRLVLITGLVCMLISLILVKPFGPTEDFGEVLHVIFIIVIGALPKILEIAIEKSNHVVKEDIKRMKIKAAIDEYWTEKDIATTCYATLPQPNRSPRSSRSPAVPGQARPNVSTRPLVD